MYTIHPSAMQLLVSLYNGPDRHYHNLNHIYYCLSKLSEFNKHNTQYYSYDNQKLFDIETITYAIWFHDAIYSPYPYAGSSNELESCALFADWSSNGVITGSIQNVRNVIRITQYHLDEHQFLSPEEAIMLDIDLSGFAKSFSEVYKDSDKIFKEYECLGLSRKVMLGHRIKFLEILLSKERMFYTDYFYNTHEKLARDNIEAVIELSKQELINDK